jgi:hypothetical protein
MLWLERQVVASLVSPDLDDGHRAEVVDYVDGALRAMPEHLRAGVAAESLVLGAWPRAQQALGRLAPHTIESLVDRWKASRIDPIRQYVRMLQSLVLFAENELVPEPTR